MHQAIGTTASQAASRESWLLIFNCQVLGLANSLNLLTDEVRVEHYDPAGFRNNSDDVLRRWDTYDRVLVAPQLLSLLPEEFAGSEKIWKIPTISFNAYHPDICHLRSEGKSFKGPLGDYHSCLGYAAFRLGLSVDEACRLYNERRTRSSDISIGGMPRRNNSWIRSRKRTWTCACSSQTGAGMAPSCIPAIT